MWRDVLNILSFAFGALGLGFSVLAWLDIRPRQLRDLTKEHLIRNWLLWPILVTSGGVVLLVIYATSYSQVHWYTYMNVVWTCVFFWTVFAFRKRESRASYYTLLISPLVYVATSVGWLHYAIYETTPPVLWLVFLTLGFVLYYAAFAGLNAGMLFRFRRLNATSQKISELIAEAEQINTEVKSHCLECTELRNQAKDAIKIAQAITARAQSLMEKSQQRQDNQSVN